MASTFRVGGREFTPTEDLYADELRKFTQLTKDGVVPPQFSSVFKHLGTQTIAVAEIALKGAGLSDPHSRIIASDFKTFLRSTSVHSVDLKTLHLVHIAGGQFVKEEGGELVAIPESLAAVYSAAMKAHERATDAGLRKKPGETKQVTGGWLASASSKYDGYSNRLPHSLHAEFLFEVIRRTNPDFEVVDPLVRAHAATHGHDVDAFRTEFYTQYLKETKVDSDDGTLTAFHNSTKVADYLEHTRGLLARIETEGFKGQATGGGASASASSVPVAASSAAAGAASEPAAKPEFPQYAVTARYVNTPGVDKGEAYRNFMRGLQQFNTTGDLSAFLKVIEDTSGEFGVDVLSRVKGFIGEFLPEGLDTDTYFAKAEVPKDERRPLIVAANRALLSAALEFAHPFTSVEERSDYQRIHQQLFTSFKPSQGKDPESADKALDLLKEMGGKYSFDFFGKTLGRVWDSLSAEEKTWLPESATYAEDVIKARGVDLSEKIFKSVRETFEEFAGVDVSHLNLKERQQIAAVRAAYDELAGQVKEEVSRVEEVSTRFAELVCSTAKSLYDGLPEQVLGGLYHLVNDSDAHPLKEHLSDPKFSDHRIMDQRARSEVLGLLRKAFNRFNDSRKS